MSRNATLRFYVPCAILATALLGLMAGFFFAFAIDVAPAMANLDAATYITTQQWINRVVRNAVFGGVYFGAVVLPFAVALIALLAGQKRFAIAWAVIAAAYFVTAFWITRSINIPINEALALWNPAAPPADWSQLRDTWNQSNAWRAWGSAACMLAAIATLTLARPEPEATLESTLTTGAARPLQ